MKNIRKYERCLARTYIGVFDSDKDQLIGSLVDISIDGLQTVGDKSCQARHTRKLRIEMHKEIRGSRDLILFAKGVWSKKRDTDGLYITGFQFLNIGETTKMRIELLMQSSAFRKYKTESNLDN